MITLQNFERMSFGELQEYIHDSLSMTASEMAQWEAKSGSKAEDEINRLLILLESKILEDLIVKGLKSVETLQQELFQTEHRKLKLYSQKIAKLSSDLQRLYLLKEAILESDLTQSVLEKAYSQMCQLHNEFFDSYYRNKYRDIYSFPFHLQLDRKLQPRFAKELPFLINQAIEKLETSIKRQQSSQFRSLEFDSLNEVAKKEFERVVDRKSNGTVTKRRETIVALRSRKRKVFSKSFEDIPAKKLPWKFFPKGQWTIEQIIKEFSKYISQNEVIDESRIWKIYDNLNPSDCYISQDGFNRYIAFCFDWTEKVVLECPIYGNAIYVIKDNWQEITKLHKWQARRSHRVTVIRHSETWFCRLKTNLKKFILNQIEFRFQVCTTEFIVNRNISHDGFSSSSE